MSYQHLIDQIKGKLPENRDAGRGANTPAAPPTGYTVTPSGGIIPAQTWNAEVNALMEEFRAMRLPSVEQVNARLEDNTQIPADADLETLIVENIEYMRENPQSREGVLNVLSLISDIALNNAHRELNKGLEDLWRRKKLTRAQIESIQARFTPEQRKASHERLMAQFGEVVK